MEQRRPRLGDILDDYCPRERRVTNHVIVAMVADLVKQTRCATCDADHEYRQARLPVGRRKKEPGALEADLLSDLPRARRPTVDDVESDPTEQSSGEVPEGAPVLSEVEPVAVEASNMLERTERTEDDGPVHRRLIRATLPRPEGQQPERKEPEFTVRQQGGRGREIDGNREPQHRQPRGPHRDGGLPGDARNGRSGNANRHGSHANHGNFGNSGPRAHGASRPQNGQPGAGPQGQGRPGGRSRRRRSR